MDDQNRNLLLAIVLSSLVMLAWMIFFPPPQPPLEDQLPPPAASSASAPAEGVATPPGAPTPAGPAENPSPAVQDSASAALSTAPRIGIETPEVTGSLSLLGGRIDDLKLKSYRETLDPGSGLVTLLRPADQPKPYYILHGWVPAGNLPLEQMPGPLTEWELESGNLLTPETPVVLRWNNGKGLIFRRTLKVDDKYMFTVTQSVENTTENPVQLAPYGIIVRQGKPDTSGFFILHEGVVGLADGTLQELSYSDIPDLDVVPLERTPAEVTDVQESGWIGFTDKYWMTTLIPEKGIPFQSVVKYLPGTAENEIYQAETRLPVMTVPPGQTAGTTTRLFAGAKEWETIRDYQNRQGVDRFIDSIDWGWFYFLTKPIFWLLHNLNGLIGNMGWAIIALTITLKAILFPLAYKSYVSMAKMKELQPQMEKIKEEAGNDRQKMQRLMMELYKKEKVNPASGCLPILLQIPIFFSLYKVIFVTIELRHAPWISWIRDLSAPDPSSILNLFGLLPFDPPASGILAIFSIGILPILLGISMWLQQKLNPAPTDPTQATIMAWMPWVFMFMLGQFPSGLVLYWITNNVITFIQQYLIMRSHGHKPDVLGNILRGLRREKPEKPEAE